MFNPTTEPWTSELWKENRNIFSLCVLVYCVPPAAEFLALHSLSVQISMSSNPTRRPSLICCSLRESTWKITLHLKTLIWWSLLAKWEEHLFLIKKWNILNALGDWGSIICLLEWVLICAMASLLVLSLSLSLSLSLYLSIYLSVSRSLLLLPISLSLSLSLSSLSPPSPFYFFVLHFLWLSGFARSSCSQLACNSHHISNAEMQNIGSGLYPLWVHWHFLSHVCQQTHTILVMYSVNIVWGQDFAQIRGPWPWLDTYMTDGRDVLRAYYTKCCVTDASLLL